MAKKNKEKQSATVFDNYTSELSNQKEQIENKIQNLESKLLSLNNKESILNTIISKIYLELENTDPKHFKAIAQLRTTLNKQLETLSIVMDMIVKIEDMIQKYRKMLIDIENQKIGNYIKLQKEEQDVETDISKILLQINNQFNDLKTMNPAIVNEVENELKELGYVK
jgi:chromosome segregation ATPase